MNDIGMTERRVRELENEIAPLAKELETEKQRLRKLKSCEFIRVNKITRKNLHRPNDFGTWFYTVENFTAFLKTLPPKQQKPWTSWNTTIHHTSDLLAGRWSNTGAYEDDVPPA